jgi:hypothetical protein
MVSWKDEYVDSPGNPKSLFYKFDFIIDNLPDWLQPHGYKKSEHARRGHRENPSNGSVVDGEATTKQIARGDRRTAILLDEFAIVEQGFQVLRATRDATTCRIFNSTPAGVGDAFYAMKETSIRKIRLHWTEHPVKARGLYKTGEGGGLEILDKDRYPADYKPILDGKMRSVWYDRECERCASPQEIAQELDIDYLGSDYQFFTSAAVNQYILDIARPPVAVGDLVYNDQAEPVSFSRNAMGTLKIWCPTGNEFRPINSDPLSISADVSAGTGASNSAAVGYSNVTRRKLFEYANPHIRPEEFASAVVALASWFKGSAVLFPKIVWESNGPGRQFGANVFRRSNNSVTSAKAALIPGWAPTREGKMDVLSSYRESLEKRMIFNYSKVALEEALEYVYSSDGGVFHSRAKKRIDPTGAIANHGDRAIADALANMLLRDIREHKKRDEVIDIPIGCLAWRNKMRDEKKNKQQSELGDGW